MKKNETSIKTTILGLEVFLKDGVDLDVLLNAILQQQNEEANFPSAVEAWNRFLDKYRDSGDPRFDRTILAQLDLKLSNALNPKPKRRR